MIVKRPVTSQGAVNALQVLRSRYPVQMKFNPSTQLSKYGLAVIRALKYKASGDEGTDPQLVTLRDFPTTRIEAVLDA
jgi:hypothetical protein